MNKIQCLDKETQILYKILSIFFLIRKGENGIVKSLVYLFLNKY